MPAYEQLKVGMIQATTLKLCMVVSDPTEARRLASLSVAPKSAAADARPSNTRDVLVQPALSIVFLPGSCFPRLVHMAMPLHPVQTRCCEVVCKQVKLLV